MIDPFYFQTPALGQFAAPDNFGLRVTIQITMDRTGNMILLLLWVRATDEDSLCWQLANRPSISNVESLKRMIHTARAALTRR